MDNFGERLKKARKDKNLSQEMLGKLIGVTRNAITNYEKNSNTPTYENMKKLSLILGVDLSSEEKIVKFVPVIGTASCGSSDLNHLEDNHKKAYYNGEFWKSSLYCVIANGDSMSPEIDDGDEVIIDPDVKCQTGDMVHYKIDNESAIKVLVIDADAHIMQFVPYNSNDVFKTRTIRLDDEETMNKLSFHKVVSVNKLKFNNRAARLKLIGR
ncbi:MAG: LexA family transcriptional regulator [Arcobacter sp.]|nr:LexA family transcriptional regulator [Arcobacter sp.]